MGNNPKISIITVSFNAVKVIEETIVSVINQTYTNVEYIIIDGGSTDGTVDIIKEYADKISYWVSESDKGIYDAMNKGGIKALGDFLYFLNAGDSFYNKSSLMSVVKEMELNGNIDVYLGNVICSFRNVLMGVVKAGSLVTAWYTPPHQGMFIKRALFVNMLYGCSYRLLGDREFLLRLRYERNALFKIIDVVVSEYDLGGLSSSRQNSLILFREAKSLAKKYDGNYMYNSCYQYFKALLKYMSSYVISDNLYFRILYFRAK